MCAFNPYGKEEGEIDRNEKKNSRRNESAFFDCNLRLCEFYAAHGRYNKNMLRVNSQFKLQTTPLAQRKIGSERERVCGSGQSDREMIQSRNTYKKVQPNDIKVFIIIILLCLNVCYISYAGELWEKEDFSSAPNGFEIIWIWFVRRSWIWRSIVNMMETANSWFMRRDCLRWFRRHWLCAHICTFDVVATTSKMSEKRCLFFLFKFQTFVSFAFECLNHSLSLLLTQVSSWWLTYVVTVSILWCTTMQHRVVETRAR